MHYQAGEFNVNLISIISGIENVSVIIVTHSYIPSMHHMTGVFSMDSWEHCPLLS